MSELSKVFLAVICALPQETDALISCQGVNSRRFKVKNRRLYAVNIPHCPLEIVLLTSGIGKVRAAAETQFAIDHFEPRYLVNFGSAGGVNQKRRIGDIVIGEKHVEYDFQSFGNKTPFLSCNPEMVKVAREIPGTIAGTIASADQNGDTIEKKTALWERYKAECCDWEGAAVIKVASLHKIPALTIRCISDIGSENVYTEYKKNYKKILHKSAPVFWEFVNLLRTRIPLP